MPQLTFSACLCHRARMITRWVLPRTSRVVSFEMLETVHPILLLLFNREIAPNQVPKPHEEFGVQAS
jgi:hypothetical protein